MNPLDLNQLNVLDALVYGIGFDTTTGQLTVTVEIDASFHIGTCENLGIEATGVVLVDLLFSEVARFSFEGGMSRPVGHAENEPPHDYEISTLRVREASGDGDGFTLEIRGQNPPRLTAAFKGVSAKLSARPPGATHDYGGGLGPGVKIAPPR